MKDRVKKQRKDRIRDPNGNWLTATLVQVLEKDDQGRATTCRIRYDDETIHLGEMAGPENKRIEFLLVWMTGHQLRGKS